MPLSRNIPLSSSLQLLLTSDWPALSHMVTLAAREAGKWSLFPEYTALLTQRTSGSCSQGRQEEWVLGGQLAGSATPDLRTLTSQGGLNGLSHLSPTDGAIATVARN